MANKIISMDSLKENAIRVFSGMVVAFPQPSKEEFLNVSDLTPRYNNCYSLNNSTICFVSDNEVFVTPFTCAALRSLQAASFCQEYFYVPFSNWDFPKAEKSKWDILCRKAMQSCAEDFAQECTSFCEQSNIQELSEEVLNNCFEMPNYGVNVSHHNFKDRYFPVIQSVCMDYTAIKHLGRFYSNNGRVVFVYRDGKTYVAKGAKIIDILRDAGYSEHPMMVPFSNGEQIDDSYLRSLWDSIKEF